MNNSPSSPPTPQPPNLNAFAGTGKMEIMLQPFLSRAILICISGTLAVLTVACSEGNQKTAILRNQQSVITEDLPVPAPDEPQAAPTIPASADVPPSQMEPGSFEMGLDKAAGAVSISQSAQSPDDWYLVASQYHDAIALMKRVDQQSPEFAIAQTKILSISVRLGTLSVKLMLSLDPYQIFQLPKGWQLLHPNHLQHPSM